MTDVALQQPSSTSRQGPVLMYRDDLRHYSLSTPTNGLSLEDGWRLHARLLPGANRYASSVTDLLSHPLSPRRHFSAPHCFRRCFVRPPFGLVMLLTPQKSIA